MESCMSHKNRGKHENQKNSLWYSHSIFLFTYKNLSLYRKGNLSNTDLYFEYHGEVESCGCPEAGDAGDWGEGHIILIRSERRPKTSLSSMEEMLWCSVFLIERVSGKRRGGEQRWF